MLYIAQNIKLLRSEKGLSQANLAKLLGIVPGTISNYENGVSEPNLEVVEKLTKIFEVSAHDLLYENLSAGNFKTKSTKSVNNKNVNSDVNPNVNFPKLQKRLTNTPVTYDMPEQVSLVTEGGISPYIKGKTFVEVPVVDIDAAAGGGAVNIDYTDEFDKLRIPTTILPATASTRRCINVAGESMEPTLFDGARIIVRLLHRAEWAKIRSGSVYVVTNRDGETFIKRVRNKLRAHGVLVLTSDNPDQRRFKPFELTEDEIFNVWAVELVITDVLLPSQREETDDLRDQISELREMFERFIQREN